MVEFRTEDACKYGDREAVMISYFRYWIAKNKANNKHYYDGRYWTYSSISAFKKILPFYSEWQIRNILASLVKNEVIQEGNFNKAGYDRTKWYSFVDEAAFLDICGKPQMDLLDSTNGIVENHKPIPIRIPISKTISKDSFVPPTLEEIKEYCLQRRNNVDAKRFYDYYNEGDWKDKNGNQIKNWKQKMIANWEKNADKKPNISERQEYIKRTGLF